MRTERAINHKHALLQRIALKSFSGRGQVNALYIFVNNIYPQDTSQSFIAYFLTSISKMYKLTNVHLEDQ